MAVVVNVYGKVDLKALDSAQKKIDGLRREAIKAQGGFKGAFSGIGSIVTSTTAKIGSGLAALGAATWLKNSVAADRAYIASQTMLRNAVTTTGSSWAAYGSQITNTVNAGSKLSAFSKGDLRSSMTALITTTGSTKASLGLLGVTMDLAARKGISVASAATLVGRAYLGNTTQLKRMGIELPKGAKGMEAIAALQKRVSGAAKAYGDTHPEEKFKNALKDIQVTIGAKLMPALDKVLTWASSAMTWFGKLGGTWKSIILAVAGFSAVALIMAPFLASVITVTKAMQLAKLAQLGWNAAQWLFNAAVSANPIGLLVLAIAGLVVGITVAWKKSAAFRDAIIGTWNAIKGAAVSIWTWIVGAFRKYGIWIAAALTGPIGLLVVVIAKYWRQISSGVTSAWGTIVAQLRAMPGRIIAVFAGAGGWLANAGKRLLGGLRSGITGAWGTVSSWLGGVPGRIARAVGSLGHVLYDAGASIVDGLTSGLADAWHKVTEKLHTLTSGLSGIVKSVLHINSPSKVFQAHGSSIGEGLALGITNSSGKAATALTATLTRLTQVPVNASLDVAGSSVSIAGAGGGSGALSTSRVVQIQTGAVQISFSNGTSASAADVTATINAAFKRLAAEIARR